MKKVLFLWMLTFISTFLVNATNVKDYGALGNGIGDDSKAILKAVDNLDDGILYFPKGEYKILRSIEIDLSAGPIKIIGEGGAKIVMSGPGPAVRLSGSHLGTSDPASVGEEIWNKERMPVICDLEIVGAHDLADGIELFNTFQPIIRSVLIRQVRYGIHLTSRSRNILIEGCHIYDCSLIGVYLDEVNIHQININNCHISYNKKSGIMVRASEIRNFQIDGNDIEYNYGLDGDLTSADIWIDASDKGSSIREGVISGNTIQAVNSADGVNVFMIGNAEFPHKIGLWSISGNHISNQSTNIKLEHCRGITISGNTFIRGYDRHVSVEGCENIVMAANVFDGNPDYFVKEPFAKGGLRIVDSRHVTATAQIFEGIDQLGVIEISNSKFIGISDCQFRDFSSVGVTIENGHAVGLHSCVFKNTRAEILGVRIDAGSSLINVSNNIFESLPGIMFLSKSEMATDVLSKSNQVFFIDK